MTNEEYGQKKQECLLDLCIEHDYYITPDVEGIFGYAFDRAYALGKQTDTISQEEIEKAAIEYVLTRQQARHNAKKEEDATMRDFDKTIKAWDAYDMEQAFEDGANFALGKQEKDAEETPISERLYEEEKSQLEWLYYYLNRAADKQENESVSVATLFEAMERLEDMFGIDLLTNGHGKPTEKDADTVIQGWVARDQDGYISLFQERPTRDTCDKDDIPYGFWDDDTWHYIELPITSFPYLTWPDEP